MLLNQTTTKPYDFDLWVSSFAAAQNDAKADIAVQWLESFLSDIVLNGPHISGSVTLPLLKHIVPVREMVAAIPLDHRVRRISLVRAPTSRQMAVLSLLRYIDLETPISTPGGDSTLKLASAVRDMWLLPVLADRTDMLLRLVNEPSLAELVVASGDRLIRLAAWDVAMENNMREDLVVAATKITLAVYWDAYSAKAGPPLCNAIGMALACRETNDPNLSAEMPLTLARELIAAHPKVSLLVLQRINDMDLKRNRRLQGWVPERTMEDDLEEWLPRSRDVIALAKDMGLSYTATLEQIAMGASYLVSELPDEISP